MDPTNLQRPPAGTTIGWLLGPAVLAGAVAAALLGALVLLIAAGAG